MDNITIDPEWSKSKEEIWDELFEPLDERSRSTSPDGLLPRNFSQKKRIPLWRYAASLLIPVLLVCHFYTVTEETPRGEHAEIRLPDNSMVAMNAESKVSYKPFEWFLFRKAGRRVRLEGEACFDVKPGSRFSVQSDRNKVHVLGTTFNVYARAGVYCVTCIEGKVEVQTEGETVVLHANMQATLQKPKLHINSNIDSQAVTGWIQGKFTFVGTPLREVVNEIERQYNIKVTPDNFVNQVFTGYFSRKDKPEVVLEIIGEPFGITFHIE
ncbi:MAG: FecR domain-containing protein [Tannerella sp.]|jgi:ferric-dicitrate binding protein FerR (iron transport regulator)|nr:FecR domain-containing protein [Tannerella sp.]